MRDRLLTYALGISIGVHLLVLCLVGSTSAAREIKIEDLKLVRVQVVSLPNESKAVEEEARPEQQFPDEPKRIAFPSPERIPTAPPPKRKPPQTRNTKPLKLPGNPGGPLDLGATSPHGQDLGPSGQTPPGWVPGSSEGTGIGSGKGPGVGAPEPVPGAVEGPSREPAPPPAEVEVPKHVSTLADRSVPELISGRKSPKYPESARDQGIEGSVTVEYTINTEGNVVGVKITSSSGNNDLDRAAVETVESRKYKPAVQAGIPRNYRKRETFRFKLN
jgi:TonB family protein